ncbi:DUF2726 domain-containing protein, partial [Patescibacteria group bacterium]|nr:DUF2726 domain-containing protein [Patescibacteria group bacterium]
MPTSIYILIGIVIIVFVLRIILGGKEKIEEKPEDVSEIKNFYLRKELMSYSERKLFEVLKKELGLEYLIFSKVRIEDFIGANKFGITSQKHFGLRNRIKSYHVDFLICDTVTTKPLFAIELDGASHNSHERKER